MWLRPSLWSMKGALPNLFAVSSRQAARRNRHAMLVAALRNRWSRVGFASTCGRLILGQSELAISRIAYRDEPIAT
jgi:hypothetical protein